MAIRDRGKLKWRPASFMPEGFAMTRSMYKDQERREKPTLDEYQREEFDQQIGYAMEFNLPVNLNIWHDGFIDEITGIVHYIDLIQNNLRIEIKTGEFQRVDLESVIGVVVVE